VNVSAERRTAAGILLRVGEGAFASRLLAGVSSAGIRKRVMAVLRWQRSLDEALGRCLKKSRLDPEVRIVLRLALAEVVLIGIPAPVAGDGAVRLVRRMGKSRASGLVNAVIRRAPDAWHDMMRKAGPDFRFSFPEWIWNRWRESFGEAEAEAAMCFSQEPADLWVFFPGDGADVEGLSAHPWLPEAWRAPGAALLPALRRGDAYAMDPSSQLVARLAAEAAPGGRILDLCAAPGGKSARIASMDPSIRVLAADLSLSRLRLGRNLLDRSGIRGRVVSDALLPALVPGAFDLVLLDAPCSGSGTFRRHPELKYRLRPEDIEGRAELQARMIRAALELVAPGGLLLYSTCSVEPEENEAHFKALPPGFDVRSPAELLPDGTPWKETDSGGGRLLPGPEWDGFSFQLLKRK